MCHPLRSPVEIIEAAYRETHGEPPEMNRLFKEVLFDCGVDGEGLTPQDLADAFYNVKDSQWYDALFACNACLAGYCALGESCSNIEFIRALVAMVIIANCSRRGDWDWSFEAMLSILLINHQKCDPGVRMDILRVVLC